MSEQPTTRLIGMALTSIFVTMLALNALRDSPILRTVSAMRHDSQR